MSRPAGSRQRDVIPCPSEAAYKRHIRHREVPCEEDFAAMAAESRRRRGPGERHPRQRGEQDVTARGDVPAGAGGTERTPPAGDQDGERAASRHPTGTATAEPSTGAGPPGGRSPLPAPG